MANLHLTLSFEESNLMYKTVQKDKAVFITQVRPQLFRKVTYNSSTSNKLRTLLVMYTFNRNRYSSGLSLMNQLIHIQRKQESHPHCCALLIIITYRFECGFFPHGEPQHIKKKLFIS